ncbi:MAG: ParB/RepB/Spo0J family partition protein [Leptospiraceae bacterium]|nr:ParB/RepB/Spo0J family partition protein [Leptospiraceae bacterium]
MANKNNVLGRGLGNLISGSSRNTSRVDGEDQFTGNQRDIKISEIKVNPNQPRKKFSQDSILELAETIKLHGLIQPIIVKKVEDGYQLIAGERRLRACKEAGFIKIPAVIKNYSEKDSLEVALLENIQREDLNPIEEALAYQSIIDKLGIKVTELASRVGKNRSTVANLIRLLQLPEGVKDLIVTGKLSEGQARPLLSIGDKRKQEEVANRIVSESMNVREVEDYVARITEGTKPTKLLREKKVDPSITQLENKLRNKFSARVQIIHNDKTGKGKIGISYGNMNELEKILSKLGL